MGKITRWLVSKGAHSFGGLPGHSHPVAGDGTIDCADCASAHGLPVVEVAPDPSAAKPAKPTAKPDAPGTGS